MYGQATTQTLLQSETADNILWSRYATPHETATFDSATASALSRIEWAEKQTTGPLRSVVEYAAALENSTFERRSRLMVLTGRSRRLAVESHTAELKELMDEHGSVASEVKKTVGDVAASLIITGTKASIVVLQAANASTV